MYEPHPYTDSAAYKDWVTDKDTHYMSTKNSNMTTRAKRNGLSLKDKVKLIKASSSSSQRQLADRFNVGRSQVNRILKRKAEFMEAYEDNECLDRKRVCVSSDYDSIDNATWLWFKWARALNMPVSGPYI